MSGEVVHQKPRSCGKSPMPAVIAAAEIATAETYTWCCDEPGCYWQASSEDRDEAHAWATEHTDTAAHPVSLYVEAS